MLRGIEAVESDGKSTKSPSFHCSRLQAGRWESFFSVRHSPPPCYEGSYEGEIVLSPASLAA